MLHPPTIPPSQYLPKHYRDRRLRNNEMDSAKFTEFLKRFTTFDVQWVVEWWYIIPMVNRVFKDNCAPLVGFRRCSYYSLYHIARQLGDSQGVLRDDGVFHILVFIKSVLGRICETWFKRMVARDICFTQFLHPTSGYKAWPTVDMRLVHKEEKDYQRSNKGKRAN